MLSSFDVSDIEHRHGYVFVRHPEQLCYLPLMSVIYNIDMGMYL